MAAWYDLADLSVCRKISTQTRTELQSSRETYIKLLPSPLKLSACFFCSSVKAAGADAGVGAAGAGAAAACSRSKTKDG